MKQLAILGGKPAFSSQLKFIKPMFPTYSVIL